MTSRKKNREIRAIEDLKLAIAHDISHYFLVQSHTTAVLPTHQ